MQKERRVTADTQVIGVNLKFLREAAQLSQYAVANVLGVSYQQVQKYESGQNRFPIENLFKLKHAYGVPYEYFFKNIHEGKGGEFSEKEIYASLVGMQNHELRDKIGRVILILLSYEYDQT